ncbi:bifunctional riboflavin kinase/FAD synthetase [Sporosarcina sp. HYO08]|uniref:bifunctional riboflavin kinase/FAD synthetase n=1 Tax=Sporosarcina sp. HYO08 TaxID=1759557 RepID=UPI000793E011|nr:bifunctional riboflavin kinase/FAD synthetase [Sporosarcina sp. HYO08]KXH80025.1 bifunctional riboflavin kinase/FMN adenylyltransferase [Sporosarcina sp. HYO08]
MDVFRLRYPEQVTIQNGKAYSLAIGFFDGLHKGHQAVIQAAKQKAVELGIESAVMTFDPHPSHLFGDGKNKVGYITQYEEKVRVLAKMGIDALFIVTFDWPLASLSPQQFVDIFIKGIGVRHVTGGFDFTFGAKGAGTMELMSQLAEGAFGTTVIEKVTDQDEKVSSTRIRRLLSDGDVEETAKLLGRPFRTLGVVVDGDKRGRLLGFPTANVSVDASAILPANGVYAVRFSFDGHVYNGVCNVGTKPTFHDAEDAKVVVEVHVLDFDGDLYGKKTAVDWIASIRKEQKFSTVEQLVEQIAKDKKQSKEILDSLT